MLSRLAASRRVGPVDASHEFTFAENLLARPEWRVNEFKCLYGRKYVFRHWEGTRWFSSRSRERRGLGKEISRRRGRRSSPRKARSVTAMQPWCTTGVSPPNFVAARVAALKQFVVLFIAASYTPGPNFVDRDKIIFRTGGSGAPASRPYRRAYLPRWL